jgi:hypothetical protein
VGGFFPSDTPFAPWGLDEHIHCIKIVESILYKLYFVSEILLFVIACRVYLVDWCRRRGSKDAIGIPRHDGCCQSGSRVGTIEKSIDTPPPDRYRS